MINVQEVIITDLNRRGNGKDTPLRRIIEVYEKDGSLIAQNDPMGNYRMEDMIEFAKYCRADGTSRTEELLDKWKEGTKREVI